MTTKNTMYSREKQNKTITNATFIIDHIKSFH